MSTVVGFVSELVRRFIVVSSAYKPNVVGNPNSSPLDQQRWCVWQLALRQTDESISWVILFERREEFSKILLRARQVHLVQQDDVAPVLVGGCLRTVETLQAVALIEALLECVVVSKQVITIPPASLDGNVSAVPSNSLCERLRQARFSRASDTLKDEKLAQGQPGNK